MWDRPMQVMTPTSGLAQRDSRLISPAWFMPISMTAYCVPASIWNRVRGRPSSLFWLPSVLMVAPRALRAVAQNSLVVVLPTLPVTPTTLGANWAR